MKKYLIAAISVILALGVFVIYRQSAFLKTADGYKTAMVSSVLTWQEQYDLGVRYLSEGNYEEAIIAFTAAIEIDPKRPEGYLGLADTYIAVGNQDGAQDALERGLAETGDDAIRGRLSTLEGELVEKINYSSTPIYDNGSFDYWIHWREGNNLKEDVQRGASEHPERFVAYYTNNEVAFTVTFEYDSLGNPTKCTGYDASGDVDTYAVPDYGDDGNLLRWVWYDTSGFAYDITEYSNWVRVRWTNYKRNGEQNAVVEYNSSGIPTQSVWYRPDGSYILREYDVNGDEISNQIYDADGTLQEDAGS